MNNEKIDQLFEEVSYDVMIGLCMNDSSDSIESGSHTLKFDIEPKCEQPWIVYHLDGMYNLFPSHELFQAIAKESSNHDKNSFPQYYNELDQFTLRKEMIDGYYKNHLVLFHPIYKRSKLTNHYFRNVQLLHIIPIGHQVVPSKYERIPKINLTKELLEECLLNHTYFTIEEYSSEIYDATTFIECQGYIYEVELASHEESVYEWKSVNERVKRMKLIKPNNHLRVIDKDDYFIFVDENYIQEHYEESSIVGEVIPLVKEEVEELLLEKFMYNAQQQNLCYRKFDLVNFHVAMKSAPLVIVAGMSGTGKTRVTFEYARVMNMSKEQGNFLVLPISPSYSEPSDITGYYNARENVYVPAEGGLVDFLLHAQNNKEQMHMVVFDEMNLAQIEHYFAQFLSMMELDQEHQQIQLYNENLPCSNKEMYPASIELVGNVLFVGTVNMDETTSTISDRLLDRSLVIHLEKQTFQEYFKEQHNKIVKENSFVIESALVYQQLCSEYEVKQLDFEFLKFMDEVHNLLNKYDSQKGISFRALKNMGTYINNMPVKFEEEEISKSKTYDFAFKQSVVSKMIGDTQSLGKVLGMHNERGELFVLLEKYRHLSDFKESIDELVIKKANLLNYGYTSK